jgi:hypothetical protein
MSSDDDFIVVSPEELSPAPAPESKETPAPLPGNNGRTWEEFINDNTPIKTYEINGVHYYIKNGVSPEKIKNMMKGHWSCVTCSGRAKKFCTLVGPVEKGTGLNGSVFLRNIRGFKDGGCEDGCLFNIRKEVEILNPKKGHRTGGLTDPKIFIVKEGCFPSVKEGKDPETGEEFEHITIVPDAYTSQENVEKYAALIKKYMVIIIPRMEKLCEPVAVSSVELIDKRINELDRPGHWTSVIKWVKHIQKISNASRKDFKWHNLRNKLHICVAAITSGRSEVDRETCVHKDYQQSSNIVDFITMTSIDEVLREMDTRSNPENYMVSQLNRRMVKENITSEWTISLSWDEKYTDDLDLHVKPLHPPYGEIFYGKKIVQGPNGITYRLDFDANVSGGEKAPCENISVGPGVFEIMVNNFTRRTQAPIPFIIILRQKDKPDIVIEETWSTLRRCGRRGDKMLIIKHEFTPITSGVALEMSQKEANRAQVLNGKWNDSMGEPRSEVPAIETFDLPYHVWEKKVELRPEAHTFTPNVNNTFMNMVKSAKVNNVNNKRKKGLAEYESERTPPTLTELMTHLYTGKHRVEFHPRDFSPGYVTKVITKEKVTKEREYSMCHYNDKFSIPINPVNSSILPGNARFNRNWFKEGYMKENVGVECFINIRNVWFMVANGTTLPVNDSDFPLAGGFRPTDLSSHFHDLRDRWAFCNTNVSPTLPESGTPMIGSFLTGTTVNLTVDGKRITVKLE